MRPFFIALQFSHFLLGEGLSVLEDFPVSLQDLRE
jgi:hypothetical protein